MRNRNALFYFIRIFFFLVIFTLFHKKAFAFSLFEEFDDLPSPEIWQIYENNGAIYIENGWLKLDSQYSIYPYIHTKDTFPDLVDNFVFEMRFKYREITPYGTGWSMGNINPPNGVNTPYLLENNAKISQFKMWQDWFGLGVYYQHSIDDLFEEEEVLFRSDPNTDIHTLKIIKENNRYFVYFDSEHVFTSKESSRIPNSMTIGNPRNMVNPKNWTDLEIDYIRITPLEEEKKALILIPGLGASWSTRGLFYNDGNSDWTMLPLVDTYNNFSQSALQLGWESGEDYYIWNYDWRKPLDEIAVDLDNYLEESVDEEKIDIVGHSLGGLVARAWKQNYDDKNQSDKIITVGSPHKGVVQAYEALAGGKLPDNSFPQNFAMRLLINILGAGYPTDADFLRDQLPVLKDISPTFDFVKKGGQIINVSENYFFNDYLFGLNGDLGDVNIFTYLSGNTGLNTPRWLVLGQRRIIDTILGLWPDGSEIEMEKDLGDGTVSLISSFLGPDCLHQLELTHGDMISDESGLEEVFSLLLDKDVDLNLAMPGENKVFFYLASPATLMVNDVEPDNPQEQFVVLPYENGENYSVKITGTGNGDFHLSYGYILENDYKLKTIKGEISKGETKNFSFDNELNLDLLNMLGIIRNNLYEINGDTNIKSAIKEIDQAEKLIKKNRKLLAIVRIKNAMRRISNYRNKLKPGQVNEFNTAFSEMNSLAEILNITERKGLFDLLRKNLTDVKVKVAERKIELNKNRNRNVFMDALSLRQALDLTSKTELFSGDIFEIDLLLNEAIK